MQYSNKIKAAKGMQKLCFSVMSIALALVMLTGVFSAKASAASLSADAVVEAYNGIFAGDGAEIYVYGSQRVQTGKNAPHDVREYRNKEVYLGGTPFGIKFQTEGAVVVGFCDIEINGRKENPAMSAGIKLKDMITGVNGKEINGANELTDIIESSSGKRVTLNVLRGGEELNIIIEPLMASDGRYKAGVWVKDSGAGIGTMTFITDDGTFGGLGHGICDSDSARLVDMKAGIITDVTVSGIIKGISGTPGEIKGYFTVGKTGTLLGNTDCGVFGALAKIPSENSAKIPVGFRDEIHEGDAFVRCTLDDNSVGEYKISISDINLNEKGNKCFCVHVTDPRLIERTGGIVQGMSGSPIIQDGKLVGAVTHVLISDPTTGYGIFIENMLASLPQD